MISKSFHPNSIDCLSMIQDFPKQQKKGYLERFEKNRWDSGHIVSGLNPLIKPLSSHPGQWGGGSGGGRVNVR